VSSQWQAGGGLRKRNLQVGRAGKCCPGLVQREERVIVVITLLELFFLEQPHISLIENQVEATHVKNKRQTGIKRLS
jgi:hypothetical protein